MIVSVVLLMVAVLAISLLGGRSRGVASGAAGANPGDPQQVALGRQLYAARCASCHGANLEGQAGWQQPRPDGSMPAPPHDATGHTWHHSDALLFAIVKQGGQASSPPGYKNGMPAFGGILSDAEIWATLAYIKSTWSPEIQQAQAQGAR